jgi:hypothetical protein
MHMVVHSSQMALTLQLASTACLLCCSHGSTELYDEANRQQLAEKQAPERSEESERLGP